MNMNVDRVVQRSEQSDRNLSSSVVIRPDVGGWISPYRTSIVKRVYETPLSPVVWAFANCFKYHELQNPMVMTPALN